MKRLTLGILLIAAPLYAAVTNLRVLGTTATQAVLSYTAPDNAACTIEVSESASYSPLDHDVDATLFSGANSDLRAHELVIGRSRAFVVGRRTSALASDGAWYSRALQNNTVHYFRITCPSTGDTATGQFKTGNIPTGATFNEGLPFSASAPGRTAFPTLPATPGSSVIDPQTGALIRRVTGFYDEDSGATGTYACTDALDSTGTWVTPSNACVNTVAATVTNSTQPLFLRAVNMNNPSGNGFTFSALRADITAASTGPAVLPADSTISVCLTTNATYPACASATKDQLLNTTQGTVYNIGSALTPGNTFWALNSGQVGLADFETRSGTVTNVGSAVTWVSGSLFNIRWQNGATFQMNGTEYHIASVQNETSLTLTTSPSNHASPVTYNGGNFGLLLWKKTVTTDVIAVKNVAFYAQYAQPMTFPASGSTDVCTTQSWDGGGGKQGYHCLIRNTNGTAPHLYWVAPSDGETRFLGSLRAPAGADYDSAGCAQNSFAVDPPPNQHRHYCMTSDHAGNTILLQGVYAGPNTDVGNQASGSTATGLTYTNLTPGVSLLDLFAAFDGTYDKTKFNTPCSIVGMQMGQLVINCFRANQNTTGWNFIVDLGNRLPLGSGGTLAVVAGQSSWTGPNCRWCSIHTTLSLRDAPQLNVQANNLGTNGPNSLVQYRVTVSTNLTTAAPPFSVCPVNTIDPTIIGTTVCTSITVSGEPQDPNANPDGPSLQNALPGDVLVFYTSGLAWDYEPVRLIVKTDSTHWIIQRGWEPTQFHDTNYVHAANSYLYEWCQANSQAGTQAVGGTYWWDYVNDPHGTNLTGTTITVENDQDNHPTYRNGTWIWDGGCGDGIDAMAIRNGTWPTFPTTPDVGCNRREPAFASFSGGVSGNFSDSHSSYSQTNAAANEQRWFADARNITGINRNPPQWSLVGGKNQTYTFAVDQWDLTAVRRQGMFASSGYSLLQDVSAPAAVHMLGDTSADNYEYCVVLKDGECVAGSLVSDNLVYVNAPMVTPTAPLKCGDGAGDYNDICVGFNGAYAHSLVQMGTTPTKFGAGNRMVSKALTRYRLGFAAGGPGSFWNARPLADGSWSLIDAPAANLNQETILLVKLPPYPSFDSVARGTFVPVSLSLTPPSTLTVNNAIVEFGYSDNGNPEDLHCTSRNEVCVADAATFTDAAPFKFGAGTTETIVGAPCAVSCTIQIPALSQRVLYYRVKYRDVSGNVLATGAITAAVVQ